MCAELRAVLPESKNLKHNEGERETTHVQGSGVLLLLG